MKSAEVRIGRSIAQNCPWPWGREKNVFYEAIAKSIWNRMLPPSGSKGYITPHSPSAFQDFFFFYFVFCTLDSCNRLRTVKYVCHRTAVGVSSLQWRECLCVLVVCQRLPNWGHEVSLGSETGGERFFV